MYILKMMKSVLDIKRVKEEFNKLNDYPILKDYKLTMRHNYDYMKDEVSGITLSTTAICTYDVDVRLPNANIFVDSRNVLNVELEKPFLDKNSVHIEQIIFPINENSSEDDQELQRYWNNTFNTRAIEELNFCYNEQNQIDKLDSITKQKIGDLLRTLNVTNYKITIK